ncbi:MAG: RNA polymerase sigma-I factor [Ignavibacteriales bacterium]
MGLGPNPHLELLERARRGDSASRENLLKAYMPFVMKIASQFCGRFLRLGEDEEAQVALEAFNEAVDCFDPGTRVPFASFAQTVMKRRLIDDLRKRRRLGREIPLSSFDEEDEEGNIRNTVEVAQATAEYDRAQERIERQYEISRYRDLLEEFGITLTELVGLTPKHVDARERAQDVARMVAEDPALRGHLQEKGELPLKELEVRTGLSRKTLERQRKYIIAIALVHTGEFTALKGYLDPGGGSRNEE